MLPTASLQIQLPCPEHNFQVDMPISTSHLQDKPSSNAELSMSTLLLRVFDVRNRILLYTLLHIHLVLVKLTSMQLRETALRHLNKPRAVPFPIPILRTRAQKHPRLFTS